MSINIIVIIKNIRGGERNGEVDDVTKHKLYNPLLMQLFFPDIKFAFLIIITCAGTSAVISQTIILYHYHKLRLYFHTL